MLRSPLLLVGAITILAAVLRLDAIGAVHTNSYYDAAVRSMGNNWHAFFYGAYEPAAGVSIDKPPIDLWLQVLSTKVFGFGAVGLIFPQALAATLAVPLLYDTVRRVFGRPAGIAAAAALAVMPVSVLTARSDTMDSLMMALTVLAAWLVVRAAEREQARWLYLAALVAGLDFEVKLFEALIPLPALVLLYVLASRSPLKRRALHLGAAGLVFLAAALWWPVIVSLTPSASRPFPIGSTDGSVWNVMFVYNGSARVHPAHVAAVRGSAAGPLRLFDTLPFRYGTFVGIELLAALVLAPLALLLARVPDGTRLQRAFLAFLAAWLLPALLLFSGVGQLHLRYLEAFTPAVAATLGVALAALVAAAARRRSAALGLALGLVVVTAYALSFGAQGTLEHVLAILCGGLALLVIALAAGRGDRARTAIAVAGALALVCVLVVPATRSTTVVRRSESDSGHPGEMPAAELLPLARYLGSHTRGDRYETVSAFYPTAGSLIARDGRPVMVLTTVLRQPVVTVAKLADTVRRGQVHYFLVSGSCGRRRADALGKCPATVRWARAHSVDVSKKAGLPERGLLFRFSGAL